MKPKNAKPKGDRTAIKLRLDPNKQEGEFKLLGGSQADQWNHRLNSQTLNGCRSLTRKTTIASPKHVWPSLTV